MSVSSVLLGVEAMQSDLLFDTDITDHVVVNRSSIVKQNESGSESSKSVQSLPNNRVVSDGILPIPAPVVQQSESFAAPVVQRQQS